MKTYLVISLPAFQSFEMLDSLGSGDMAGLYAPCVLEIEEAVLGPVTIEADFPLRTEPSPGSVVEESLADAAYDMLLGLSEGSMMSWLEGGRVLGAYRTYERARERLVQATRHFYLERERGVGTSSGHLPGEKMILDWSCLRAEIEAVDTQALLEELEARGDRRSPDLLSPAEIAELSRGHVRVSRASLVSRRCEVRPRDAYQQSLMWDAGWVLSRGYYASGRHKGGHGDPSFEPFLDRVMGNMDPATIIEKWQDFFGEGAQRCRVYPPPGRSYDVPGKVRVVHGGDDMAREARLQVRRVW